MNSRLGDYRPPAGPARASTAEGRGRAQQAEPARAVHERVSMTQDVYMSQGTNGVAAAAALDRLAPAP
ncbi:MAG: hypothetical protein ACRDTA_14360 [Pseudonocardiaceae bacterium]